MTLVIAGVPVAALLSLVALLVAAKLADRNARYQAAIAYARQQRVCVRAIEYESCKAAMHDPSDFTSARWLHDHERVAYWDAVLAGDVENAAVIHRWTESLRQHIDSLPEHPKVTVTN